MELYQTLAQTRLCIIYVCLCDACYGVLHALVYKEEHLKRPVFHLSFRTALAQVCATHFVLAVCVSCAVLLLLETPYTNTNTRMQNVVRTVRS